MMPARSAGILFYRRAGSVFDVLLVHPGGPFWRNKDVGAWQMPKGMIEPGENDETAARREVAEELGIDVSEPLSPLGEIRQAGGETVIAYAVERDVDPSAIVSNTVEIAWPPRSGRKMTVPEIDEARWFSLDDARHYMLISQSPLLDRLAELEQPAPDER
ncbi:NUDIX domain-containing protein [Sphingomonas sp. PB4P5]|uniref:NUDIX domain-containing protein n=1 Tax=Parasphingomonas puruogangriensis TaxID=3096155 RepID=UPI002FCB9D28